MTKTVAVSVVELVVVVVLAAAAAAAGMTVWTVEHWSVVDDFHFH